MIQVTITIDERTPFGQFLLARAEGTGKSLDEVALTETAESVLARIRSLHEQYCRVLDTIFNEKFGGSAKRTVELDVLVESVTSEPEETRQIQYLRALYPDKKSPYQPENEKPPLPWDRFLLVHPDLAAPWMIQVVGQLRRQWM